MSSCEALGTGLSRLWEFSTKSVFQTTAQRVALGTIATVALLGFSIPSALTLVAGCGGICWLQNTAPQQADQAAPQPAPQQARSPKEVLGSAIQNGNWGALPGRGFNVQGKKVDKLQEKPLPTGGYSAKTGNLGSAILLAIYSDRNKILPKLNKVLSEETLFEEDGPEELIKVCEGLILKEPEKAKALYELGKILRQDEETIADAERENLLTHLLTLRKDGFPQGINKKATNELILLLQLYEAANLQEIPEEKFLSLHKTLREIDPTDIGEEMAEVSPEKVFDVVRKQLLSEDELKQQTGLVKVADKSAKFLIPSSVKAVVVKDEKHNKTHAKFLKRNDHGWFSADTWTLFDNSQPDPLKRKREFNSLNEVIKEGFLGEGSVLYLGRPG